MKHISSIIAALWFFCLLFTGATAHAQPATHQDRNTANQWLSHQMNQPPPGATRISSTSQERLDEIRQLYELAKREAQAGSRKQAAGSR